MNSTFSTNHLQDVVDLNFTLTNLRCLCKEKESNLGEPNGNQLVIEKMAYKEKAI